VDTKQAIVLGAAIIGVVQLAKTFVWGTMRERITAGIVLAASISMTYLTATSAWGNEQIVGGKHLDELGWSSLLLVGIVLGALAATGWEAFTTVRNVGQNQLTKVQVKALDSGAERLVAAQLNADQGGSHPADHGEYVFDRNDGAPAE
jgi:hypothetical protein